MLLRPEPCLFMDIDSLFVAELDASQWCGYDLMVHKRAKRSQKTKYMAGVLFFNNNSRSINFLKELVLKLDEDKKSQWFDDQIALSQVIEASNQLKIKMLDKKYIDWELSEHSVIWVGKGDIKSKNQSYLNAYEKLSNQETFQEPELELKAPIDLAVKVKPKRIRAKLKNAVKKVQMRRVPKGEFSGKRVAVVGNATKLLNENFADLIDRHDCVVRFNTAYPLTLKKPGDRVLALENLDRASFFVDHKTKPATINVAVDVSLEGQTLAQHIGKKTTHWVSSTSDADRLQFYFPLFKNSKPIWLHPDVRNCPFSYLNKFYYFAGDAYQYLADTHRISPSSGLVLLSKLATEHCAEINLFGFDFFESYNINRSGKTRKFFHQPNTEKDIIKKLIESNHHINIY